MEALDPWAQRRFGLFVQANLASVAAWAPIGTDAAGYLTELADMPEVLLHRRQRWGHVPDAQAWAELVQFDHFAAEDWAQLTEEAGAGHLVQQVRDTDGWCWWDAPGRGWEARHHGSARDLALEVAQACARRGLGYGTAYTPGDDPATAAQLVDLVERVESRYLWAPLTARTSPAMRRTVTALRERVEGLILNDAWGAPHDRITLSATHRFDRAPGTPWELQRGLGAGCGYNRVETARHLLSPLEIVALYTEVIARGGALLLGVGVGADGRVPEMAATPLRAAGRWIRAHREVLERTEPWETWGESRVRYLRCTGTPGRGHTDAPAHGEHLLAIDLDGRGLFSAVTRSRGQVEEVTRLDGQPVTWTQTDEGVRIDRGPRRGLGPGTSVEQVQVYRLVLRRPTRVEWGLFDTAEIPVIADQDLDQLCAQARPGAVVSLGAGVHRARGPLPDGITLRGLGPTRTTVIAPAGLHLGVGTRVEMLAVEGRDAMDTSVHMVGADGLLLGVRVHGTVSVLAPGAVVRGCELRALTSHGVDRVQMVRCRVHGEGRSSRLEPEPEFGEATVGICLHGGSGHLIDGCDLSDHPVGIAAVGTGEMTLRGNGLHDVGVGVRLHGCEGVHLVGTTVRDATRAVDIVGGAGHMIDGNAVTMADSGCMVRAGATDVVVAGNHWQHCRVGLMLWEAGEVQHHANTTAHLLEPEHAVISGPS